MIVGIREIFGVFDIDGAPRWQERVLFALNYQLFQPIRCLSQLANVRLHILAVYTKPCQKMGDGSTTSGA